MRKISKELEERLDYFNENNLDNKSVKETLAIINNKENKEDAWSRVMNARKQNRPTTMAFINAIFDSFIQLHGDRLYGDDKAVIGGLAMLGNKPVTVIGLSKGNDATENIARNFGMAHPEGYRKAIRLMEQANKFKRPVITIINTPGAYPGIEAEQRGQGEAIAQSLVEMSKLEVPVISLIIGEGGSGGALALAVANKVWMLENSVYSILSPEGFASILYKDASKASEVAGKMKITSDEIFRHNLIDLVISEREDINKDFDKIVKDIKNNLIYDLNKMNKQKGWQLREERYNRFKNFK